MRKSLALAALLLAPAVPPLAAQTRIDVHRAATPTASVRLSGAFSRLNVVGWDHDSISITGSIGAGSRFDGGPFNASGPVVGMKFYLEAPNDASAASNQLELRVPRRARVWVKAGSAMIHVEGVTGGLDLNIVGGSVKVFGKPRELIAESMDGSVEFSGEAQFAKLKTATGDVGFDGFGEDVTLTTVSGTVTLNGRNGVLTRARLESVTGPIFFGGSVARGGDVRFDTHSGAIEIGLPARADVEIDAASITGSIENRWNTARPIAGREGRGMELGTSSGMGGARVQVRSFKGNVRLTVK